MWNYRGTGFEAWKLLWWWNAKGRSLRCGYRCVDGVRIIVWSEKCGSYICNDLLGCDITTKEGHQHCMDNNLFTEFCPKMVATAVEIVEEIIGEIEHAK